MFGCGMSGTVKPINTHGINPGRLLHFYERNKTKYGGETSAAFSRIIVYNPPPSFHYLTRTLRKDNPKQEHHECTDPERPGQWPL